MENTDPLTPNPGELQQAQRIAESPLLEPETLDSLPSIDPRLSEPGFQHFDSRNISVERIAGSIFTSVVGISAIVGIAFLYIGVGLGWIFYGILAAGFVLFCLLVYSTIVWPGIEHRHRTWRLTDVGLEVRQGVWWKHMQAIPWARVQHADVSQGPLQRAYGVGTLTVHTAGTSNSSVNLGGLSHDQAISLRDEIIRQRTAGDVV